MNTIQELQKLKEELIWEIDERIKRIIEQLENEDQLPAQEKPDAQDYEIIYPLNAGTGVFKGKRPTAILFSENRRVKTPTWKSVATELLMDCCSDAKKCQALMDLRGKVQGRNRVLLGSEIGKMRSPVKIKDALYVETHYDAETLLRIITTRILDEVKYNYSDIKIAVKAE